MVIFYELEGLDRVSGLGLTDIETDPSKLTVWVRALQSC